MLKEFINDTLGEPVDAWSPEYLSQVASLNMPDAILGRRHSLLRSDIHLLWATWFAESMDDPHAYPGRDVDYARMFSRTLSSLNERFSDFTEPEKQSLASVISRHLFHKVKAIEQTRARQRLAREDKRLLLDLAGPAPRCWLCGRLFREEAIARFLEGPTVSIPLPSFIDVLKPIGLHERDLRIEVDHVIPYAAGGGEDDNLRLACGWCNRHKRDWSITYECPGIPRRATSNKTPIRSLPQPFWVVRLIGTVQRCEYHYGCDQSTETAELTVAPRHRDGALNPTNLRITCHEHDPVKSLRLVPRRVAAEVWSRSSNTA